MCPANERQCYIVMSSLIGLVHAQITPALIYMDVVLGIKTSSGGVCWHNARGRVQNRKSNPEAVNPRECIVTANSDRLVLIMIITWQFQFSPMNVSILHLKYKYHARSESCFACYSHCHVTWCPLMTGIVALQFASSRDAVLVTRYLTPFISACLNSLNQLLLQ